MEPIEITFAVLNISSFYWNTTEYRVWTAYKETAGSNAFKAGTYYHTDWLPETELPLKIDGLTINKVYENFLRQVANDALQADSNETLKETIKTAE